MPELNIEEKIQEALKKKSFKENKWEYLGLSLIFCLMLFVTFVIGYLVPFLAILVFIFVDIPFIMGFKHFVWFGPASGETLIDGFKVSMICGYLNFVSYIKIFITTNIKAIMYALLAFFISTLIGAFVLESLLQEEFQAIFSTLGDTYAYNDLVNAVMENEAITEGLFVSQIGAFGVALITFYCVKLNRAILPYISFLRFTSLEGKAMDGIIAHTKKVMMGRKAKFYLKTTLIHMLYLVPVCLSALAYYLLSLNPVYSNTTLDLMCVLVFSVTMFPAVLFIELNYRDFCVSINQEYLKEHKKMLNVAINDLDKK